MPELSYQDVKKAFDEAELAIRYADLAISDLSVDAVSVGLGMRRASKAS
jgi:hypothetical protein